MAKCAPLKFLLLILACVTAKPLEEHALGWGDKCDAGEDMCGVGLTCQPLINTCDYADCEWTRLALQQQGEEDLPQCDQDRTFAARQCNQQECHCITPDGQYISRTVYRQDLENLEDMTCACDRIYYQAYVVPFSYVKPIRCDALGNYSPMQCRDEKCFCVDKLGYRLEHKGEVLYEFTDDLIC